MKRNVISATYALLICLFVVESPLVFGAEAPVAFQGKQSQWNGYPRFDFQCDGKNAIVVAPKGAAAEGRSWLWRGEFFGAFATVDLALLEKGWHVAYLACPDTFGGPETMGHWVAFYDKLTKDHQLSHRPVLLGMSRGGFYVYNWAALHPDKVGLIYGDAPVCDAKSWPGGKGKSKGSARDWELFKKVYNLRSDEEAMRFDKNPIDLLEPIVKAHIPIIHVCGDADDAVPMDENTLILKDRLEKLGGKMELIVKPGVGHHPHSLADPTPIVEFILKNTIP